MKLALVIFTICIIATLVAGCDGSGSGGTGASSFTSGSGFSGSGSGSGSGSDSSSGSDSGSDSGSAIPQNPEPITLALFGTGLAAFALLRRKKK